MDLNTLATELLKTFLDMGKVWVFPKIPSRQLRAALQAIQIDQSTGILWVPHYWAIFAHDGRGPSPAIEGSAILVWFRNPEDDPRLPGGRYPVTRSEVRHLTKEQFREWASRNRTIIKEYKKRTGKTVLTSADYSSMDLPMIVAKSSPRSRRRVLGVPFFDNRDARGMLGFKEECNAKGKQMVSDFIVKELASKGILNKKITRTIVI
jgi:hypothetical protein